MAYRPASRSVAGIAIAWLRACSQVRAGAWSETDAPGSPAGAVLNDVSLAPAGQDAQPETGKVTIPNEIVARPVAAIEFLLANRSDRGEPGGP